MKIIGTITKIWERATIVAGTSSFEKQTLIVEEINEEVEQPNSIGIDCGERLFDLIDTLRVGDKVTAYFSTHAKVSQTSGGIFNSIRGFRIVPATPRPVDAQDDNEDLPF